MKDQQFRTRRADGTHDLVKVFGRFVEHAARLEYCWWIRIDLVLDLTVDDVTDDRAGVRMLGDRSLGHRQSVNADHRLDIRGQRLARQHFPRRWQLARTQL